METKIGKIKNITFGFGGYQEAMLGLSIELGSDQGSWGAHDFKGWWAIRSEHCKWTEEDWKKTNHETFLFMGKLLTEAKKTNLEKLKGVPVEVIFENSTLKSWRILTEVL